MDCKGVFDVIDTLEEKYISIWQDVCNIESPTRYKAGVDKVGEYFINIANEHNWKVEILDQSVAGDAICITMNDDAKEAPVSLSGHMDTVQEIGVFGNPAVSIDGEKIYGPGVVDCKGGIVAAVMVMEALEKCGYNKRPIKLLLQSDEEVGSSFSNKETINYICDKAKNSVAFLNLEGHAEGTATLTRKGIINLKFVVKGIEGHSSQCAVLGANAVLEAAHKIIEIEKIKDDGGITCCCSIIEGGSTMNTIPGECSFNVNVRYATSEQAEWIRKKAEEIAKMNVVPGCSCEVFEVSTRCAMEPSEKNNALLEKINEIYERSGMKTLESKFGNGGSDAAEVTVAGIPCIDSIGTSGGNIHTEKEFAYLSSLKECARRVAAIVSEI